MDTNTIIEGDCLNTLQELDKNSVHAVITDPPYGLAFMGRSWDDFDPKEYQEFCEKWAKKAKRVLKPGGHLLAFSGNRTHHRLFTGVEDAGFEIRDTLTWHYGSGFPKATDISKTIDKREGVKPDRVEDTQESGMWRDDSDWNDCYNHEIYDEPTTEAANKWDGWKTGLKPATEYVVMARKPFDGATVDCVLEHGTGALNIGGCRIETGEIETKTAERKESRSGELYVGGDDGSEHGEKVVTSATTEGRYPSNVVFDETEAERLDWKVGDLHESTESTRGSDVFNTLYGGGTDAGDTEGQNVAFGDSGGPSRYFYTSKASKSERTENGSIENSHPTVKPIDLMEWLVKLIAAENQIVLDPFAGSGTTCKAAKNLNREFIGIEKQAKWADVARVRCNLTPNDPSVVRESENQNGLEEYTD